MSSPLLTGLIPFGTPAQAIATWTVIVDRYLLGSGGTLVFDLTIMIQSLIYGSAPPIDERDQEDYIEPQQHHHHRSRSSRRHSKRITDEESRPLIERPDDE